MSRPRICFQDELSANILNRFYIDGCWRAPDTSEQITLRSPVTEEVTAQVPAGSPTDMSVAVRSARSAFDHGEWPRLSVAQRAAYLTRIAHEVRRRQGIFERLWTGQVGAPVWFTEAFTALAAAYFDYYAQLASTFAFEEERPVRGGQAKVIREPVGVCALIIPWNAPLILLCQKLAPALLAGCTVVVKPSPETPLDAMLVAECVESAGLPRGVVNVVAAGRDTGDWLVRQPDIDKVSFTGSTAAGKHIAAVCAERVARVSLELGGKSASILCDDADLGAWLQTVAPFTMPFCGQVCFSQTRVLVSRHRHDEVVDAYASAVRGMRVGDPWDESTQIGPLSMERQLHRVRRYIETGKREGARLVAGGGEVPGCSRGYFVAPTVFDAVTPEMTLAREEVFGPVVSILTYDNEEQAVQIANQSDYGLSGTVFAADVARAEGLARRIRTGNISVNSLQVDPSVPFGGYKQSGIGREGGREGLEAFLEVKTLYLPA